MKETVSRESMAIRITSRLISQLGLRVWPFEVKPRGVAFGIVVLIALCALLNGSIMSAYGAGFKMNTFQKSIGAQNCTQSDEVANNPFISLVGKKRVRCNKQNVSARVQRYVLGSGGRAFLFQDTGNRARIQFLCAPNDQRFECQLNPAETSAEIHTLLVTRAPRGDVIYKNTQGETLLRIASYGGATVWWPGNDKAQAASRSFSDRRTIGIRRANAQMVIKTSRQASRVLSQQTGSPLLFETGLKQSSVNQFNQAQLSLISKHSRENTVGTRRRGRSSAVSSVVSDDTQPPLTEAQEQFSEVSKTLEETVPLIEGQELALQASLLEESALLPLEASDLNSQELTFQEEDDSPESREVSLLADSVMVTSIGIAAVAADPTGARVIGSRLKRIRFIAADRSEMRLKDKILNIYYNPDLGLAGRPSSIEITKFLEENL